MGELFLIILLVVHLLLAMVMSAKLIKQSKIKRNIRVMLFVALWLIPLIGAAFVSDLLKIRKANQKNGGIAVNSPGGNSSDSCSSDGGCD
ncbi:hypothetical protein GTQ48_17225 [Alteromonas genovensis]|uniref:Uncharacterized protein n=1 Tax=Alteromonas genovensis TaxID=471225 RepID=A0A6N9TJE4_9ALTE|nr:hypothetical protein [Alteromonas genovensis]NDW17260.1 hypothetical protein [Alteromonas genovensis]